MRNLVDRRAKENENIEVDSRQERKLAEYIQIKKKLLTKKNNIQLKVLNKRRFYKWKEHDKKGKEWGLGLNIKLRKKIRQYQRKWRLRRFCCC